jgi:hypothetical protein
VKEPPREALAREAGTSLGSIVSTTTMFELPELFTLSESEDYDSEVEISGGLWFAG